MVITIDGAAGVGKTSTAKELAKRLGYQYFDTGAMYRAVTLFFIRENVDLSSKSEVVKSLDSIKLNIDFSSESEMQIYLDEDAEYFKTHQIPNQKGQLFFIYADSIKNDFGKSSIEVQPEEGDMFIFPSQLSHYTAPVLGKSYRYSISCNFSFTTKAKNLLHKMSKNEN